VLALGLLFMLPFLVVLWIVVPVWQGFAARDQLIADEGRLLRDYRRAVAAVPQLEARLARLKHLQASQPGLLPPAAPAQAAALLQDRLKQMVAVAGGTLQSVQPQPPVDGHGLQQIRLRLELEATWETLVPLLGAIEQSVPFLFADRLAIRGNSNVAVPSTTTNPRLAVALEVHGFMRPSP
jgi:hypothetical protein